VFAEARVGALDHEPGDRPRGVILARVAGVLEIAQELLIDVTEQVTILGLVEINAFVEPVDDLPQQRAGLHVVIGVLEGAADELMAGRASLQLLESGEKIIVDELHQPVAGDAFGIGGPVAPAQFLGEGRAVIVAGHLQLSFLSVEDFEEQHPCKLGEALSVAIDANVFAHDVLDGFDGGGERQKRLGFGN
jgi:hypothetical protein